MKKRIITALLALSVMLAASPAAYAAAMGFASEGRYGMGDEAAFKIETEEAVYMFNGESEWKGDFDYGELYSGGLLYIPVYCDEEDDEIASMTQISSYDVKVSYKVDPDDFVKDVTIVDGSSANDDKIESGAYIRVEFDDAQAEPGGTSITLQLVLTINRITDQETRVWMRGRVRSYTQEIKSRTIYNVQMPSSFQSKNYNGEVTFEFPEKIRYTANVQKGGYYHLSLDRDEIKSVVDSAEKKTNLEFYTFEGNYKTFASSGQLEIPVKVEDFRAKKKEDPKIFVYEINGTSLRAMDESELSYRSSTEVLTIRARTLGSYVLSSQPLLRNVEDTEGSILHTGYASDGNDEPTSSQTSSQASSQTLPPLESSTSMPSTPPLPSEYVDNPNAGGDTVYAANKSTHNPSTADTTPIPLLLLGCAVCAAALPTLYRRAFPKKG